MIKYEIIYRSREDEVYDTEFPELLRCITIEVVFNLS